jgi:hypothetical protein
MHPRRLAGDADVVLAGALDAAPPDFQDARHRGDVADQARALALSYRRLGGRRPLAVVTGRAGPTYSSRL